MREINTLIRTRSSRLYKIRLALIIVHYMERCRERIVEIIKKIRHRSNSNLKRKKNKNYKIVVHLIPWYASKNTKGKEDRRNHDEDDDGDQDVKKGSQSQ